MMLNAREALILKQIVVASENDPEHPEFPPHAPKFPATPTYQIEVPGFTNVWLKDESKNPTGTHKDRMAWEIVVTYRSMLLAKKRGQISGRLPNMSIISSGSAAVAIQTMLMKYGLPNLHVLVDYKMKPSVKASLKRVGCELFETDLSKKPLTWKEILSLTNNWEGFDITSADALDPTTNFYDWLSYEIINSSPVYCFVPFGTGNLFENILNVTKHELATESHDPRFNGNVALLRECNFIGVTTNNAKSKAEKLYSPHSPFKHYDEQAMRLYKYLGFCGSHSDVIPLEEQYLLKAMEIAEAQGITCEPSGIAGLGMLLQLQGLVPKDAKVLIVNTGKTKYP
ncbi:MAG: PLP-dependent lyase/thiolase [Candidatus Woesearchaeota archaeon]